MTTDDKNGDERLQFDINRKAAKISALSSGKIDKYEYLTGEKVLPSNQRQIREKNKLHIALQEKLLTTKKKTIEDQGEKQIKAIEENKKINR